MDIPDYLRWPLAQNFGYRILERLSACSKVLEDRAAGTIEITGRIPLASAEFATKKEALCVFRIDHQWAFKIPHVICLEPWITIKPPEWHIYADRRLCFEFDLNWQREMPLMVEQYTFGLAAEYGVTWMVNSSRSLLNRHLFAFRNGITVWPKSWDYWAHSVSEAKQQLLDNLAMNPSYSAHSKEKRICSNAHELARTGTQP